MLKVTDLSFKYGNVEVLHNISFEAQKGKITVLIGTNGAGKTTTMKSIMGLSPISSGRIEWDGKKLSSLQSHKVTRMGLSLCPEGRQLFPDMTVYENLVMGAYQYNNKDDINKSIEDSYKWFPILEQRKNQLARTLSGGEQEMLAIARALMAKPELLMLDEPSWGLAPILVDAVSDIIRDICERGTTILLVEQNTQMALELADYVYVLETGNIVMQGTGQEMASNEKITETFLGI